MSKRYGRTQKHKHQQRIKELEQQLAAKQQLIDRDADVREAYWGLVEAIQRVCAHSSLLPPKQVAGGYEDTPIYRLHRFEPLDFQYSMRGRVAIQEAKAITLYRLELLAEKNDYLDAVHITVRTTAGSVAYYLSEKALATMDPKHLARHIATQLADRLQEVARGPHRRDGSKTGMAFPR